MASRTPNTNYSTGVELSGLWRAKVVSVDNDKHISVTIPKISPNNVYTEVWCTGQSPEVGDYVWVSPQEGKQGAFVAISPSSSVGSSSVGPYTNFTTPTETWHINSLTKDTARDIDLSIGSAHYYTKPVSANWTVNVGGLSDVYVDDLLEAGNTLTVVVLHQNASTGYYMGAFDIDGFSFNTVNLYWLDGIAPSAGAGTPNAQELYTFTIVKIDDSLQPTYNVYGSFVPYSP